MTAGEAIAAIIAERDPRKLMGLATQGWEGQVRRSLNEQEERFTKRGPELDYWVFEVGGIESNREILKAIDAAGALIPYRWRIAQTETTIFAIGQGEEPRPIIMPAISERKRVN